MNPNLSLDSLFLLLLDLQKQGAIDVGKDTPKGNGGTNQGIKFFITANRKLKVTRGNALDFEILGSILEDVSIWQKFVKGLNLRQPAPGLQQ